MPSPPARRTAPQSARTLSSQQADLGEHRRVVSRACGPAVPELDLGTWLQAASAGHNALDAQRGASAGSWTLSLQPLLAQELADNSLSDAGVANDADLAVARDHGGR